MHKYLHMTCPVWIHILYYPILMIFDDICMLNIVRTILHKCTVRVYPNIYNLGMDTLCLQGATIASQAWALRRMVSTYNAIARRPHVPRERGLRQIMADQGLDVEVDITPRERNVDQSNDGPASDGDTDASSVAGSSAPFSGDDEHEEDEDEEQELSYEYDDMSSEELPEDLGYLVHHLLFSVLFEVDFDNVQVTLTIHFPMHSAKAVMNQLLQ